MDEAMPQECIICYNDEAERYVLCPDEGHATCVICFTRYVEDKASMLKQTNLLACKAETAQLESDSARALLLEGRIFCPQHGACGCKSSKPFDDRTLALHLSSDAFASYVEARALLPAARQVQASLQKGAEMRALFPNARQCRRCSYGPVENLACNDLMSHHGELTSQGVAGGGVCVCVSAIDPFCDKACLFFMCTHAAVCLGLTVRTTVSGVISHNTATHTEIDIADGACCRCGKDRAC